MKFFSLSRESIPVLVTLAIVLSLGIGYYYVYVPGNESDIKKWKFRSLENIGRNIQSKVLVGHKQLRTYLLSDKLIDTTSKKLSGSANAFLKSLHTPSLPISIVSKLDTGKVVHDELVLGSIPKKLILTDSATRNGSRYQLSLTYDFDKFVGPLLTDQVFDQYLIIGKDEILHETFNSGISPGSDTLLKVDGKLRGSMITDREYAGAEYKVFILPVNLNADTRILVVGLLTTDHYTSAKTRLPTRLVLFLITLFTCILVTFPIIKLYQLRGDDRLTLKDVVSVTIVSMLLMSLIFLCFVKYSSVFSEDRLHSKMKLADAISSAFVHEIEENYSRLDKMDSLIESNPHFQTDFYGLGKTITGSTPDSAHRYIDSAIKGIELDRFFWMDKEGVEVRTWTSGAKGFFPGKFDQRDYFKNTISGRNYTLDSLPGSQLFVDQIVSWVSGDFLTVIAKPSNYRDAVASTIVFRPQSLKSTRIPPGYQFAMIDYNGRVLYHSDTTKNLNENLFDEFSDEKNLQASVKTGASRAFKTRYYGKEYHVQMKPVGGGLPYYLVILESLMFEDYRDINVYSFTLSMQLLLFGIIIVQVLTIFLISARRSFYKGRSFDTGWLGPKKTCRREYIFAGVFNIVQFLILSFLFTNETVLTRLFLLLASISIMPIFLNLLFFEKYKKDKKEDRHKIKFLAAIIGLIFLGFLNGLAFAILSDAFGEFMAFELMSAVLGAGLWAWYRTNFKEYRIGKYYRYQSAYTGMLVSWMFVAMGFSVDLFFRAAYNYDQHLIARYTQLEFAESNAGETARDLRKARVETLTQTQKDAISGKFYKDKYWVDTVYFAPSKEKIEDDEAAIKMLSSFHLYSNESIPARIQLNNPKAFDFSFYFNKLIRQDDNERGASLTFYRILPHEYMVIASAVLDFHLPGLFPSGWLPWIGFVGSLIVFYFVVLGLVRKIFSLDMADIGPSGNLELAGWLAEDHSNKVFLVGLQDDKIPSDLADTLDLLEMPGEDKILPANKWEIKLSDVIENSQKPILLDHFEHNFKNAAFNNRKMSLLEKLTRKTKGRKIMIRSAIHPMVFLAALDSSTERDVSAQSTQRWHSLLRTFTIAVNQLPESFLEKTTEAPNRGMPDPAIFEAYTAHYHRYYSIWQSLSEEEKFLLFDLAEDGLVNSFDRNTFTLLIKKGLISPRHGRFRLFAKGFRSFILTGLAQSEMSGIIAKINDNANWNRIRMPLMLVSLAILIFIFSSQREASVKLLTTLGALATAIPALINLLSAISGNNSKKPG